MKFHGSSMIAALTLLPFAPVVAWDECIKFQDVYTDGKDLCERMWDNAFEVVEDSKPGYTMWFFDMDNNPNDQTTRQIFGADTNIEQCHLQYFHKELPGPEGDDMRECHPWKNEACCNSTTVTSATQLKESYGEGYEWDRCGPMSQACERFFVMEACFYECEPAAGLYRKHNDSDHPDYNEWQMHKMPIQKSFCDAWYTACKDDLFCGDGSYFSCSASYEDQQEKELREKKDINQKLGISLAVIGAVAGLVALFACFLVSRERSGKPVFVTSGGTQS